MIVFVDTNIILDILLGNPTAEISKKVLALGSTKFDLYISASSAVDIIYKVQKTKHDIEYTKKVILNILNFVKIAAIDESCIENALQSNWNDVEDSVQHQVALQIGADLIVTWNVSDFKKSAVRVATPNEFLEISKKL